MKTALEATKEALYMAQNAMNTCVDENGVVMPAYRYKYQMLSVKAEELQRALAWLLTCSEEFKHNSRHLR